MKKQFTLGLAALVFASSTLAVSIPGHDRAGKKGATQEQLDRLRNAGAATKSSAVGKSPAVTAELARISKAKGILTLAGNGLENLTQSPMDITYEAKLEGPNGEQVGSRDEKVNTRTLALEVISFHERIEAGTVQVTATQKAGTEALLKFLAIGEKIDMAKRPGESDQEASTNRAQAIKFVKVMKDTVEMKKGDTTEEDIQSYVSLVEMATKGVKAGETMSLQELYLKLTKEARERNANCLE